MKVEEPKFTGLYIKVKSEKDWEKFKTLDLKDIGIPNNPDEIFHGNKWDRKGNNYKFDSLDEVKIDDMFQLLQDNKLIDDDVFIIMKTDNYIYFTVGNIENYSIPEDLNEICNSDKYDFSRGRMKCEHQSSDSVKYYFPLENNIQVLFKEVGINLSSKLSSYMTGFEGGNFDFARPIEDIDGMIIRGDSLLKYNGTAKELIIPSNINRIEYNVFYKNETLEKIELPANLTDIEWNTFKNCTGLREVVFPEGLYRIGSCAFEGCRELSKIKLPTKLDYIMDRAFLKCSRLLKIDIPESVSFIGAEAFNGCDSLTEAKIPASTMYGKEVGGALPDLFNGCSNLKKICIYKDEKYTPSVWGKGLAASLFESVPAIEAIDIPYQSIAKNFQTKALIGFIEAYSDGAEVDEEIKNGYLSALRRKKNILEFKDHPKVIDILLQGNFTEKQIDSWLEEAGKTDNIDLVAKLSDYKKRKFVVQNSGKEKTQKEKLTKKEAGENKDISASKKTDAAPRSDLKKMFHVHERKSVSNEGTGIYYVTGYNGTEEDIIFPAQIGNKEIKGIDSCYHKEPSQFYREGLKRVVLPEGYEFLGKGAFKGCENLEEIILPSTLKQIGEEAFSGCKSLKRLKLPSGLNSIGDYAFTGCKSLNILEMPSGLCSIGKYSFSGCSSITKIMLPDSVKKIGGGAFGGCRSVKEADVPISASYEYTAFYESPVFNGCTSLEKIRIYGDGVPNDLNGYQRKGKIIPAFIFATDNDVPIEALNVPFSAVGKKIQSNVLIGFIEAYMRGEPVKENIKEEYFEAMAQEKELWKYMNRPLMADYIIKERLIPDSEIDSFITRASTIGDNELTAKLLKYKHQNLISKRNK